MKLKQNLDKEALILVIVATIAYIIPRIIHRHALGRIGALRNIPEISDLLVILLGAGFLKGKTTSGVVTGAGISLLINVADRLGLNIPRLRRR